MRTVEIYVDTSIKGPRRSRGTCLYVLSFTASGGRTADTGDRIRREETTEHQLVLLGLEAALKRLKEPCRLILHLECAYVASALRNGWHEEWRAHGWMTARNAEVRDADIWRSLENLLGPHEVEVCVKEPHAYREWMRREMERERRLPPGGKACRRA